MISYRTNGYQLFDEMPDSRASVISANRLFTIPEFDGNDPQSSLSRANLYFKENPMDTVEEWDTFEKVKYVYYFMIGPAEIWFVETFTDEPKETWESFCEKMLNHFTNPSEEKNLLNVADTENHAVRVIDFVEETVQTLAGNGQKGSDYEGGGKGTTQLLNSPWDVCFEPVNEIVYIAMAGQHQNWKHNTLYGTTRAFSGNGYERNLNGDSSSSTAFAQPSGISLSPDLKEAYIADSESSSIRPVLKSGGSRLLAGSDPIYSENLFKFGVHEGVGSEVLLQHPIGVFCGNKGDFYIADKYDVHVVGIDLFVNIISFALERAIGLKCAGEFEVADCTKKEYPSGAFDVIYSRDTILHSQDKPALSKSFYKWLKPGVKVLISDYCRNEGSSSAEYIFQIMVYQGLLIFGEKQIGKGSRVLFNIIGAGKFGGNIFRILMSLPSMMLMIVSGVFSPKENAQSQVSLGVGIFAGMTVFSLTIQWRMCLIDGRQNFLHKSATDPTAVPDSICWPAKEKLAMLKETGVTIDSDTNRTVGIMLFSLIPYIIVQLEDIFNNSAGIVQSIIDFVFMEGRIPPGSYFQYSHNGIPVPFQKHVPVPDRDRYLAELLAERQKLGPFMQILTICSRLINQELMRISGPMPNQVVEFERMGRGLPYQSLCQQPNGRQMSIGVWSAMQTEDEKLHQKMATFPPPSLNWGVTPSLNTNPVVKRVIRLDVPIEKYPDFNFVGRILGPRGNSLKGVKAMTDCRIYIRGRGSVKDSVKEETLKDKPGYEHLNEPLHILVEAEFPEDIMDARLDHAIATLDKLLVDECMDVYKKQQLRELAMLNGHVIDKGLADPSKVVVLGGLHGGFLTTHLIDQAPDKFVAAAAKNPVCSLAFNWDPGGEILVQRSAEAQLSWQITTLRTRLFLREGHCRVFYACVFNNRS